MNTANQAETKTWKSRAKMVVAGLALAGALAGGVSAATDQPVPAEDTTETATWSSIPSWRTAGYGVSWR